MATCPKCFAHYDDSLSVCATDGERLLPDEACKNFDMELQPDQMVGEYKVEKKIGEGAFGKVYAAVHPVIGKRAAIKVLNREYSSNPSVVSRFVSEARAVNQIRHRNIIDVFSFGTLEGGLQYFVMELLDGVTFDRYIEERGRLSPEEAIPIMRDIGRALDAAHAKGVAHRDLKPENVFLSFDEDDRCHPKLLDFGIAKLMGETDVQHHTRTGSAIGTPLYMSPEQCRGQGVDHRTDIYSFGVMMHEVLTGSRPFGGNSVMDLMFKHAKEPPPPMSSVCAAVPAALDAPVLRMLEKEADARPQTLGEAVDQLSIAANQAGLPVAMPTTKVSRSAVRAAVDRGGSASVSALESSATELHTEETVARATGDPALAGSAAAASAGTMGAVEAEVAPKKSGNATIIAAAAAALVVGIGATVVMMQGGDAAPGAETATETTATAEPEVTAEPVASVAPPAPEVAASAPASASASAASAEAPPKPPVAGTKPPPAAPKPPPVAPKPPPTQPKTTVVPDDIPNPFD